MDLYDFFNSSAAYRVRIAMALKGIPWNHVGVNLRAGEQHQPGYKARNPNQLVPVLHDGGETITQSLAIIDHLDRKWPVPRLIPADGPARTRVLEIALTIACDMHPLNNMRVRKYLGNPLGIDEAAGSEWVAHWLDAGFSALEPWLPADGGWCVGDAPTLADCCLVPQVANALRATFSLGPFPRVRQAYAHCMRHEAFRLAAPSAQPDYVAAH
ncbi:maleylacetoacetate isomerase [Cupriavidus sp. TA19]|uniref:maleylacetoacetate isomerase n=1 Tax=unclassified Cupriavidus TaxID=2640874 RepID=UPI000E2F839C|nr:MULTISPECIES: maleylacetoacetate isomerase [unclassified Cupriavidus]GLC97285.1 maleylacetoacetate isomerase [Cupriavidus sp. TA19]